MNEDPLHHLLKHADALLPESNRRDTAARVRSRARRSDRIRSTAAAAILLIGVGIIAAVITRAPVKKKTLTLVPDRTVALAELQRLDAEASRHAALAERMLEIELPAHHRSDGK